MRAVLFFLAAILSAPTMAAQPVQTARYTFAPVEDGALRLDTKTGAVSLCTGGAELTCKPVAETGNPEPAEAGLESRIARLEERLAALEAAQAELVVPLPDEEAMDRVITLTDRMMRRFLGLVEDWKRDLERDAL